MTVSTTAHSSSHPPPALPLPYPCCSETTCSPAPCLAFFASEAAKAFHESLYRQKLATLLEKKKLSEEDDGELRKMQVG